MIATAPATTIRSRTRLEFIEAMGQFCRRLGLPRSVGQIYGLLFFSERPLSLDDMVERLRMSKASASTGTRQLVAWKAIRQVWVPGERRDYFEVVPDVTNLLRNSYRDIVKPRIASSRKRFEGMLTSLEEELSRGALTQEEFTVCAERLRGLCRIQKKIQTAAPLIERFL